MYAFWLFNIYKIVCNYYLQLQDCWQLQLLDCYKGEDCMESFCKGLREHAMKIMNYEKKEIIPLTDEENELYKMQKVC